MYKSIHCMYRIYLKRFDLSITQNGLFAHGAPPTVRLLLQHLGQYHKKTADLCFFQKSLPYCDWNFELHRESDVDDITILNFVLFAFDAEFSGSLGCAPASAGYEILVGNGFHTDKAATHIGMDFACRFRCK